MVFKSPEAMKCCRHVSRWDPRPPSNQQTSHFIISIHYIYMNAMFDWLLNIDQLSISYMISFISIKCLMDTYKYLSIFFMTKILCNKSWGMGAICIKWLQFAAVSIHQSSGSSNLVCPFMELKEEEGLTRQNNST